MRRHLALLAIAGCSSPEPAPQPPPPHWVYAPAPVAVLAPAIGRLGRSQAPQHVRSLGITGELAGPLHLVTPWAVPGDGARAVLYGVEGVRSAIELVDVDGGRVLWRDTEACAAPVVGVTAEAIVCADANGVRGVGLDGKSRWKVEAPYLAMTEDRVVTAGAGELVVLDATSGDDLAHVKLPAGVMADSVLASCGDVGREVLAAGQDGKLTRITEAKGGPAVAWATAVGRIDELDACTGETILVREAGVEGGALVAIDRATGKVTGRVVAVHGFWSARDGSELLEIATAAGLTTWPRDLTGTGTRISPLAFGELLAERGDTRLVRTSRAAAALLDRDGVRAYLPFAMQGAVVGDAAIVAASWTGGLGHSVRRFGIPARYRKQLRIAPPRPGVALPAELRDLPVVEAIDPALAIAKPDVGMHAVAAAALDPTRGARLYTLQLEKPDDETGAASIAAVDLAKRAWLWERLDGCGIGEVVGLAVAGDVIVCASRVRTTPSATVRATSREGAARWAWQGDHIDQITAAGDSVLVRDADRLIVLDARTGELRGRFASDGGGPLPAAAVAAGAETYLVTAERGRIVARLPGAMLPLWSIEVAGIVRSIDASDAGVIVALEDGDAYRITVPEGAVFPVPGLDLEWHAPGDVIAAATTGGPIPGVPVAPPRPLRVLRPILRRPAELDPERPRMWTPIPPPAPLGESWQLTLYELDGGLRARNDYGLVPPLALAHERGPAGSPLVVASGPGLREVLVIDPRDGDPLRRVQLGEDAAPGLVFGTVVDGTPVAGAILQAPLRVVIF